MSNLSNPGTPVHFYELEGSDRTNVTLTATWQNWDLTALVPAGAVAVLIATHNDTNGGFCGTRADGSILSRIWSQYDGGNCEYCHVCELPSSRIIEIYQSNDVAPDFILLGYWL